MFSLVYLNWLLNNWLPSVQIDQLTKTTTTCWVQCPKNLKTTSQTLCSTRERGFIYRQIPRQWPATICHERFYTGEWGGGGGGGGGVIVYEGGLYTVVEVSTWRDKFKACFKLQMSNAESLWNKPKLLSLVFGCWRENCPWRSHAWSGREGITPRGEGGLSPRGHYPKDFTVCTKGLVWRQ